MQKETCLRISKPEREKSWVDYSRRGLKYKRWIFLYCPDNLTIITNFGHRNVILHLILFDQKVSPLLIWMIHYVTLVCAIYLVGVA